MFCAGPYPLMVQSKASVYNDYTVSIGVCSVVLVLLPAPPHVASRPPLLTRYVKLSRIDNDAPSTDYRIARHV